jgi:endonuclease/exonuclease/phosphatase family metal-dependent hydrolase
VRLRVVVWNVRGFRGGLDRAAKIAGRFEPDLVLLNETGGRRRLRRFARAIGMTATADPYSPFRRRVKNGVLVRPPWRVLEHRLQRFADSMRAMYPRGMLVCQIDRDGFRLCAVCVHLGLHPMERLHAAQELCDLAGSWQVPTLVGGDLNERPEGRAVGMLAERLGDAWLLGGDVTGETFPASDPTARIDYLFVSAGVTVDKVMVPPGPAVSDHLPVVAELSLQER